MVSLIQSFYSFLFSVLILPLDGINVYKTTVAPSLFLRAVCLHQQAAHVTKFWMASRAFLHVLWLVEVAAPFPAAKFNNKIKIKRTKKRM